jgi:predicted CopG family antitoxin
MGGYSKLSIAYIQRSINYNGYIIYNNYNHDNMENTTIAVSNEVKEKIKEFGQKGETYSEVINKLLESAKKRQLQDLLMDEENTISIDEAISHSKKRW